jgi:hypothetical protein
LVFIIGPPWQGAGWNSTISAGTFAFALLPVGLPGQPPLGDGQHQRNS